MLSCANCFLVLPSYTDMENMSGEYYWHLLMQASAVRIRHVNLLMLLATVNMNSCAAVAHIQTGF